MRVGGGKGVKKRGVLGTCLFLLMAGGVSRVERLDGVFDEPIVRCFRRHPCASERRWLVAMRSKVRVVCVCGGEPRPLGCSNVTSLAAVASRPEIRAQ